MRKASPSVHKATLSTHEASPSMSKANSFSLEGETAMVTGASRGLGQAIAISLAEAGANVVCVSSRRGGAANTAAAIRKLGRETWELAADLSVRDAVQSLADEAEKVAGQVGILVNNAG